MRFLYLCLLLLTLPVSAVEITSNDVYGEIYKISQDIQLLKSHFNITQTTKMPDVQVSLSPRHVWQKTYQIMVKIDTLREINGLPPLNVASREPEENTSPLVVYAQTKRLATEIDLLKRYFGVKGVSPLPPSFANKTTTDNYKFLNQLSYEMDLITGTSFNTQQVFAEAMRIHDDISFILEKFELQDKTMPPLLNSDASILQTFRAIQTLLKEIQRIQTRLGLDKIQNSDYIYDAKSASHITETELFGSLGIILAELQPIKARLGLTHLVTPVAKRYKDKNTADILKIVQWNINRLKSVAF
ncbi:hypothetical protein BegalDRAFT_1344 [Beggiatoa alba B18LD]|uniref:Uncharacterized protein n=1 Tax=Beggiatoa alba B18LD TaxID=395493 RepID=I3CF46_9GAMM|nr:hypothetical protein [Beggiatoa alba]EIJ42239.1 hypothetical protein BegalDRAFT_1344 [Beggiatoa alba B18LD]